MRNLRAFLLISGFFALTFPLMPVQLVLNALCTKCARRFPHWYHRQVCRLLGIRIHVEGAVGERPALLVSNHISWLDIPVLSAVAPVSFVAKSEVGTWPLISWLARLQNSIFVERERRQQVKASANAIMNRLAEGGHVVIFAEGTSSDGNQVLPFKTSLFAAVKPGDGHDAMLEDRICVQTVGIGYTRQYGLPLGRRGRPGVAWYGDMEIASHAWDLLGRGPLDVHVVIGAPVRLSEFSDRKALAAFTQKQVHAAVTGILSPRRKEPSQSTGDSG